ncbi:MAG: 3-oxoacyl-[acyl-carrier-protein] synthase III C-terminal domain-containing protein [Hyphomicrobium sp.]
MTANDIAILGTGTAMPQTVLHSQELDERYKKPSGWFLRHSGVAQRHVCTHETASELAANAARMALSAAKLDARDIDAIISATAVPEQPIPAMAPLVQQHLGLAAEGTPAFDINSSCLSFLTACDLASAWIGVGRAQRVLVVSSEVSSRGLPWRDDPATAALFGDGAAAAVIGRAEAPAPSRFVAAAMQTFSQGYRFCELGSGGTRFDYRQEREAFEEHTTFKMDGRAVYGLTAKVIRPFLDGLLDKAKWTVADIDWIVPHQASRGALDHIVKFLHIPKPKVIDILANSGNQIAASLPSALHEAIASGRMKRGDKVLMVGTSAGLSVGGIALVY